MKSNRLTKVLFFIALILPTITIVNSLGWGWDPGGGGGDTTPPYIAFVSPASGATVSGTVTITVYATDSGGMDYVKFYVDSTYIGTDSTASSNQYSKSFNSNNFNDGGHLLKAYAYDDAGNVAGKTRSVTIDNLADPLSDDPMPLSTPTHTGWEIDDDAARHPSNSLMVSMARRATGYGWRKLGYIGDTPTATKIVRGLREFADDWLEECYDPDNDALTDLEVAAYFNSFYSTMSWGDITIARDFDCRDISTFLTGMAMAMGVGAKMLSCEFGNTRHMVALLYENYDRSYTWDGETLDNDGWFLISIDDYYVDGRSSMTNIRTHLGGINIDETTQEVLHWIYDIDVWSSTNQANDETGWYGWFLDFLDGTLDAETLCYLKPDGFDYYSTNPYGLVLGHSYF